MKFFISLLSIFLLLTTAVGAQQQTPPIDSRQPAVEAAVTWYDVLLADGYRSLNMRALNQVATSQISNKAYFHMAALGEAGIKMDSKLQKITFNPLKEIAPNTVEIQAKEDWEYTYWEIKTGKRLFDNSVHYRLTYTLKRVNKKWLVTDITVQQTVESKDSSFIFQRPPDHPPGKSKE